MAIARRSRGPEHPDTAQSLDSLAGLYRTTGDYAKAEPLFKEALRIRQKVLGAEHPDTASSLNLATHGFFAKEDPTATQPVPQAPLNERPGVTRSKFFKNPMHRSGLALAGARSTLEAWKRDEVPPSKSTGSSRPKRWARLTCKAPG